MSRCGCTKDKFDDRDYLMRAYLPVIKLSQKIDYIQKMSPVRDQGDKGACVGFAVAAGMKEYQEMLDYQKRVESSPRFVYEETLGGHAICCVGYENGKRVVKFKNSWSAQWGAKGFGYLPYAYIERYMMDAWLSVDTEDPNPLTLASVISYQTRALV